MFKGLGCRVNALSCGDSFISFTIHSVARSTLRVFLTEHRSLVVGTPDSCLRGLGFKSQL